jgi:hypothetical protein
MRALPAIGLLFAALIVPAAGQARSLTQDEAKTLIKEYQCYSMRIADAQAVLFRKWFKTVGASDDEFTNFQANVELARRDLCGEITLSDRIRNYGALQPPFNGIVGRFQNANVLTDTSARLALQESLERYAELLESSCNLQTEKQIATSLLNRMRSLTGGATGSSAPPPPFNASDSLGSCRSGGGGQSKPRPGDR